MAKIDEITFGKLVCGGKVYRSTLLVYRNKVESRWWRKSGELFSPEDFKEVIESHPDIIILGVGILNKIKVAPETFDLFERNRINHEVLDSRSAVKLFNELHDTGKSVVGAFHLM